MEKYGKLKSATLFEVIPNRQMPFQSGKSFCTYSDHFSLLKSCFHLSLLTNWKTCEIKIKSIQPCPSMVYSLCFLPSIMSFKLCACSGCSGHHIWWLC